MNGWVKLYRELLDKAIWALSTPEQKAILITLILMANHEEKDWEWMGKRCVCGPGQLITSLEKIAKEAGKGISIQNVRTAIVRFEKLGFLTNESTKQSRLITICNWGDYQSDNCIDDQQSNKHLTNNQQTPNKHLTTNKNVRMKEDNTTSDEVVSVGGKVAKRFSPPSPEEIQAYAAERGYADFDADRFADYYTSNGWMVGKNRMKDWQAAVRSWARKSQPTTTTVPYVASTTHRQPPADFHEQRRSEIARQVAQGLAATTSS